MARDKGMGTLPDLIAGTIPASPPLRYHDWRFRLRTAEEQAMRGGHRSTTWQKGCASPNPGGRPKALHDLQELARQHTEAAIDTLAKIMSCTWCG